jgi:hypothetical protein
MRYARLRYVSTLLVACFGLALGLGAARADDFRIETKVYSGKVKSPLSQNTTLFRAGYVYDYLSIADRLEQVAVFDQPHGRFILLDPTRKLKAEVATDDVLLFATKLHTVAAKSSNAFTKFVADPDFDVTFSEDGELNLASTQLTYRLQTVPAASPEAAAQYREFSDAYARFNTMANPGSTPPFARLVVNAELAKRGLLPAEVQLTIPARSRAKAVSMRSEHIVSWRLLPRDEEKIAETAKQLVTFKKVDFGEFAPIAVTKR